MVVSSGRLWGDRDGDPGLDTNTIVLFQDSDREIFGLRPVLEFGPQILVLGLAFLGRADPLLVIVLFDRGVGLGAAFDVRDQRVAGFGQHQADRGALLFDLAPLRSVLDGLLVDVADSILFDGVGEGLTEAHRGVFRKAHRRRCLLCWSCSDRGETVAGLPEKGRNDRGVVMITRVIGLVV